MDTFILPDLAWTTLAFLLLAGFVAGVVDAVVGGGGLVQIPALFAALPGSPPVTLFGTNKLASVFGTASAAWRYTRSIRLPWPVLLPAAVAAFVLSHVGAIAVSSMPAVALRPLILILLVLVTIYTYLKPNFGSMEGSRLSAPGDVWIGIALGGLIGFYDGFFGPGAGSFMVFTFIRFLGMDFLKATASAKVVNMGTNAAALLYFVPTGAVLFGVGLGMAVCNVAGALIGTHLAMHRGTSFVRIMFLMVACAMIVKFAWETFA